MITSQWKTLLEVKTEVVEIIFECNILSVRMLNSCYINCSNFFVLLHTFSMDDNAAFVSPVSPAFHTEVTVSIGLKN